ncbi:MAG: hypothetical protein M0010_22985 [Actinomycetota bacterium]|nr:hypothetical protein [Actinomycetota bacterium]
MRSVADRRAVVKVGNVRDPGLVLGASQHRRRVCRRASLVLLDPEIVPADQEQATSVTVPGCTSRALGFTVRSVKVPS